MRYGQMIPGVFGRRLNRFVAEVEVGGKTERVHVKNTGRLKELLLPGARVWLEHSDSPTRKTAYDLITVEAKKSESSDKGETDTSESLDKREADASESSGMREMDTSDRGEPNRCESTVLVNIDSQVPNLVTEEWLKAHAEEWGISLIRREVFCGESRFDFYLEWKDGKRGFLEVKGVTLDEGGIARFPDAPTERGVRHVDHLASGIAEGYRNGILFVIARKGVRRMEPNERTQPEFGAALRRAAEAGVKIMAVDCIVGTDSLTIDSPIPVRL